uniref:ORF14 protein n=1 Tax=Psittacine aviadenovirus B TaxID=2169709 RepID=A0AB38ZPC3_9ADEN
MVQLLRFVWTVQRGDQQAEPNYAAFVLKPAPASSSQHLLETTKGHNRARAAAFREHASAPLLTERRHKAIDACNILYYRKQTKQQSPGDHSPRLLSGLRPPTPFEYI